MPTKVHDITRLVTAGARCVNGSRVLLGVGGFIAAVNLAFPDQGERRFGWLPAILVTCCVLGLGLTLRKARPWFALSCWALLLTSGLAVSHDLVSFLFGVGILLVPPAFLVREAFLWHRTLRQVAPATMVRVPRRTSVGSVALRLSSYVAGGSALVVMFAQPAGAFVSRMMTLLMSAAATAFLLRARRMEARSAEDVRKADRRPPVLLLRSFSSDGRKIEDVRIGILGWSKISFEEILTQRLWDSGPVIALGCPGEPLPPVGAARDYLEADRWKPQIDRLIGDAGRIVVIADLSPGLRWEVQRVVELGALSKTWVVAPPVDSELAAAHWRAFEGINQAVDLGLSREDASRALLLAFSNAGDPLLLTVRGPKWIGQNYDVAVALARARSFEHGQVTVQFETGDPI